MRLLGDSMVRTGLLLVALVTIGGCAGAPPAAVESPEIPSPAEIAESERLRAPATPESLAALGAYQAKVCGQRAGLDWDRDPPKQRTCYGAGPAGELRLLEEIRERSHGAPDEAAVLERLIGLWSDIRLEVDRECGDLRIPAAPTVHDVERALAALLSAERWIHRYETEPARLCAELATQHPQHVRRVRCPGDPPRAPSPEDAAPSGSPDAASPDWPSREPASSAAPRDWF